MQQKSTTSHPTTIRRVGQGRYIIPSRTRAAHDHHIDLVAGTCSCEASQHGKRCWAYAFAEAYSTTMGAYLKSYRLPAATPVPDEIPRARPAGMAALQECFG